MSADSRTVCPKCHPEVLERVGVLSNIGNELGLSAGVRENIDYYIQNFIHDGPRLVFVYSADCWECNWNFHTTIVAPIRELK